MPDYRAYLIGEDGHFMRAIDLDCADDKAAKEYAQLLIDGHDAELWQQGRKIAVLSKGEARGRGGLTSTTPAEPLSGDYLNGRWRRTDQQHGPTKLP